MASYPTYNPDVWVGGITQSDLDPLYSDEGQHAAARPGRPGAVRARLDVQAVHDRRGAHPRLHAADPARLLVVLPGGQPDVQELRVRVVREITFAKALQVSCDTFFYRVGYQKWLRVRRRPADVNAKDPLVNNGQAVRLRPATGIDMPGEVAGRIADRHWKLVVLEGEQGLLLHAIGKNTPAADFLHVFAREFCTRRLAATAPVTR